MKRSVRSHTPINHFWFIPSNCQRIDMDMYTRERWERQRCLIVLLQNGLVVAESDAKRSRIEWWMREKFRREKRESNRLRMNEKERKKKKRDFPVFAPGGKSHRLFFVSFRSSSFCQYLNHFTFTSMKQIPFSQPHSPFLYAMYSPFFINFAKRFWLFQFFSFTYASFFSCSVNVFHRPFIKRFCFTLFLSFFVAFFLILLNWVRIKHKWKGWCFWTGKIVDVKSVLYP